MTVLKQTLGTVSISDSVVIDVGVSEGEEGVTKIVAGENVTISPDEGTGRVVINATGGGDVTVEQVLTSGIETAKINDTPIYAPESGDVDVEQVLTSGIETAKINGTSIYAPEYAPLSGYTFDMSGGNLETVLSHMISALGGKTI